MYKRKGSLCTASDGSLMACLTVPDMAVETLNYGTRFKRVSALTEINRRLAGNLTDSRKRSLGGGGRFVVVWHRTS